MIPQHLIPGDTVRLRNIRHYAPRPPRSKQSGVIHLDYTAPKGTVWVFCLLGRESVEGEPPLDVRQAAMEVCAHDARHLELQGRVVEAARLAIGGNMGGHVALKETLARLDAYVAEMALAEAEQEQE